MKTNTGSIILILAAAVATALAQIVLKIGSRFKLAGLELEIKQSGFGAITGVFDTSSQMFHFFMIGIGFILFMLTLVILSKGFKGGDMSVLYPVFATSFIWNIIFSKIFIGERVNIFKIIGVLVIVTGIALTGFGHKKKSGE